MTEGLPLPRRLWAIAAVSFGTALVVIDGAIPTVALPTIARDLGVDESAAVLVVTIYQLVLVMTLLPFAALGDRIGHRRLYQLGQLVFVAATDLSSFSGSRQLQPDYEALVTRVFDATTKAGLKLGGPVAWKTSRKGYSFFQAEEDTQLLRAGIQAALKGQAESEAPRGVAPLEGTQR